MFRFTDKAVLVTGGSSGLGRGIARAFAAEGARVVVSGRTTESLKETVRLMGGGHAVIADVTRPDEVERLVAQAVEHTGGLDIAVNNAGILRGIGPVADVSYQDWHTQLDTNLTGVWLAMKYEIGHMRANGGAIVNIASTLGAHRRIPNLGAYITTKAAVSALTRAAALDHIQEGIRINAVSPGASATPMSLLPGETDAERAVRMKTETPLGRVTEVDEIAAAVLYLASDDAAAIVGADLVIDSGTAA